MKRKIHCEAGTQASDSRDRPAGLLLLAVLVTASAFFLGLHAGHRLRIADVASEGARETIPELQGDLPGVESIAMLDGLLARIDARIQQVATRQETSGRESRRNRIAYRLMRDQGYDDASTECTRLVQRQRTFEEELRRFERDIAGMHELRTKLIELRDRGSPGPEAPEQASALRREVDLFLAGERPATSTAPLIPDVQWTGGADLYMEADTVPRGGTEGKP